MCTKNMEWLRPSVSLLFGFSGPADRFELCFLYPELAGMHVKCDIHNYYVNLPHVQHNACGGKEYFWSVASVP